jgi:hypothetical protein
MSTSNVGALLVVLYGVALWLGMVGRWWAIFECFRLGIGEGLLCTFAPFYDWYFAYAKYRGPDRGLMLLLIVGSFGVLLATAVGVSLVGGSAPDLAAGFGALSSCLLVPGTLAIVVIGIVSSVVRGSASDDS